MFINLVTIDTDGLEQPMLINLDQIESISTTKAGNLALTLASGGTIWAVASFDDIAARLVGEPFTYRR